MYVISSPMGASNVLELHARARTLYTLGFSYALYFLDLELDSGCSWTYGDIFQIPEDVLELCSSFGIV